MYGEYMGEKQYTKGFQISIKASTSHKEPAVARQSQEANRILIIPKWDKLTKPIA